MLLASFLATIAKSFHVSAAEVGWIPTLTQLGYASGLLLFVPLGDRLEQRRLIVIFMVATFLGSSLGSVIGTYGWNLMQWTGVCIAGLLSIAVAAMRFWLPRTKQNPD